MHRGSAVRWRRRSGSAGRADTSRCAGQRPRAARSIRRASARSAVPDRQCGRRGRRAGSRPGEDQRNATGRRARHTTGDAEDGSEMIGLPAAFRRRRSQRAGAAARLKCFSPGRRGRSSLPPGHAACRCGPRAQRMKGPGPRAAAVSRVVRAEKAAGCSVLAPAQVRPALAAAPRVRVVWAARPVPARAASAWEGADGAVPAVRPDLA